VSRQADYVNLNLNRKRVLAGLVATGIAAGVLSGGGVAFASSAPAPAPAMTTATAPASGRGNMGGTWSGGQTAAQAAAGYLGLSQAQLSSQLQSGKSLAAVAKAQGKPVSGLENAILAAMTSQINASTGPSAAQKTAMISKVKNQLGAVVNMTYPSGNPSGMGMHRPAAMKPGPRVSAGGHGAGPMASATK
jgi:hypothetical protein